MTYTMDLKEPYLGIPVLSGQETALLEIFAEGEKVQELFVTDLPGEFCDYHGWIRLSDYVGKRLTLKGQLSDNFFSRVRQATEAEYAPVTRPMLHFTANRGWLNDPNGLVYQDGIYHLYFQYNPTDTRWGNMSWGHAVSADLLNFRQVDTVLFPDETGAVYSGSGIACAREVPEIPGGSLAFFYTAAGGMNPWSRGKAFTQRIAVSTDGGRTLKRLPGAAVDEIGKDSRDPQVFWHEDSSSYVMVLWVQEEEIALLRSENLRGWELTDRFTLPGAFECPNLFQLPTAASSDAFPCQETETMPDTLLSAETAVPDSDVRKMGAGDGQWVLTVADGSYYFGSFDGFRFHSDGVRRRSYLNELAYAAQIFNGVRDRTVMIPWLRTKNEGRLYTGAMGLPRELGLAMRNGSLMLQMKPVREYEKSKKQISLPGTEEDMKGPLRGILAAEYACDDNNASRMKDDAGKTAASEPSRSVCFEIKEAAVTELVVTPALNRILTIEFFGNLLTVERDAIVFGQKNKERTSLPEPFTELHLLIDRQIIEVYGNDYTQIAYYETGDDQLTGMIRIENCNGMPEVYQWQSHSSLDD